MKKFAFFLKTYRNDYQRAARLLETYRRYNMEQIPLFLICPVEDLPLFSTLKAENIIIMKEEEFSVEIFHTDGLWTAGYLNQEIYKLAFWELGLCRNYLCLDSDGIFLRPFYVKDFMYDENTPYTVLVEDNDLRSDCYYNRLYWDVRRERIKVIEDEMNFHPYRLLTCHGFQIFSSEALRSLKEDFMKPRGYQYKDLVNLAPYEFSWYNLWVQKSGCISLHPCEPLFKYFHLKQQHMQEVLRGMSMEDWAKGYIGIVVNSNYGVGNGDYNDLSVYHGGNAGLPLPLLIKNFCFYSRLLPEALIRMVTRRIKRLSVGTYRVFSDKRSRRHEQTEDD